ncbi:rod shape-determining protein MreD [bacterium BMS3Abin03]|jgi:rod shape-determining protein MreD|nr:rod shape-determining protein MreD [bacterium BMS3Abin03]MCG6959185.1 rod shape-determining protein MreD [bacterium BMS3Abin03]
MKLEYITPLIVFFLVYLLQITIVPLIRLAGIIPDLILIILVYYSISRGQLYGTILGAVYGLLIDLISGNLLGLSMLSKTIAGFTAGYFTGETKKITNVSTYNFSLIVLLCSIIDTIIFSFFSTFDLQTNIFSILFEQALLPSLYTAVVSILFLFYPFRRRKI